MDIDSDDSESERDPADFHDDKLSEILEKKQVTFMLAPSHLSSYQNISRNREKWS